LHYCFDHFQSDQKDGVIIESVPWLSLAKPEGHLLYGSVHELDRQIAANRQLDRHSSQPGPRSTQWIVCSFLTVPSRIIGSQPILRLCPTLAELLFRQLLYVTRLLTLKGSELLLYS